MYGGCLLCPLYPLLIYSIEENKKGFEGKSRTLTQFITFEEYKSLYGVVKYLHEENRSRFTNSKHFVTQDE